MSASNLASITGLPITGKLIDGQRLGSFYVALGRTINSTDTSITINLDRIPSLYIIIRNKVGDVVYDGSNFGSDWTPSKIVLRAITGGTASYGLLIA